MINDIWTIDESCQSDRLFANFGVNEAQNNKNVSAYAFPFTAFLTLHDLYILPPNFLLLYV